MQSSLDPRRIPNPSWRSREGSRANLEGRSFLGAFAIIAILGLFLVSCTTLPEPDQPADPVADRGGATESASAETWEATPPFYRVDGGGGATLQLLGTIHLGPDAGWSFPPDIEEAIDSANSILVEVDLRELNDEVTSQAVMRHGILPAQTPLSTIIGPETAQLIEVHEAVLEMVGAPAHVREAMQPWFIMILMAETAVQESGMSPAQSVESGLMEMLGNRELLSLETFDQQLAFFGGLSFPVQELILRESLKHWEESQTDLKELVDAWRQNDQPSLLRIAYDGLAEVPELKAFYDVLIDGRNRSWLPRLVELLEDPERADETVLVAVGALHLVGPMGVPNLLRTAGYRLEAPVRRNSSDDRRAADRMMHE